jgi:streptogramin lyase
MRRIACVLAVGLLAALIVAVPVAPAAAGVAQQPSLWLTDDETGMVYNVTPDGDLIGKFPVPGTRRAESSIAIDPVNRTLWGANDGSSARLVNYDRQGNVPGDPGDRIRRRWD